MDFIPHTAEDDRSMLDLIGVGDIDDLFEPIPKDVLVDKPLDVPSALSEPELLDHLRRLSAQSSQAVEAVCFAGGGAYDHYVPAVVKALASRAEFATSYTPYQPELSQGVLQALYEFQTLVCELYGMEVANASLYDGANAVVEAVNLAIRSTNRRRIVFASSVHPHVLDVVRTYTSGLDIDLDVIPYQDNGATEWSSVASDGAAAVVCAYPNVFGRVEDVEAAAEVARKAGAISIAVTDPTAMGLFKSPGELGFDVAVGEGQALGTPLSYGGPYLGLFATKLDLVRQVPGRIAGETLDANGGRAYVLTLQAREQHIRRAKATSNVCTNQTLMAIAAAVHLSWLGPTGLARVGELCVRRTASAVQRLGEIPGCTIKFDGPRFKELVLQTPLDGRHLAKRLARRGYLIGPHLSRWFPELTDCVLIAITERRTEDDIEALAEAIEKELAEG